MSNATRPIGLPGIHRLFSPVVVLGLLGVFGASIMATLMAPADSGPRASALWLLVKWTPLLFQGFLMNMLLSVAAMALGTVIGAFWGLGQLSHIAPLRGAFWTVTQFFRNAPWLVILFFVMFLVPFELRVAGITVPLPDWLKAIIGLSLPVAANFAEILRGAVQSISSGQWESAESFAFSRRQTMWLIILPQCLRRMLPPWMNLYAMLTMTTVLASIVGVQEVMATVAKVNGAEGRTDLLLPIYTYVLIWFFTYCYPIARFTRWLEQRSA
jgi:polar amino acid transport system permease protein